MNDIRNGVAGILAAPRDEARRVVQLNTVVALIDDLGYQLIGLKMQSVTSE